MNLLFVHDCFGALAGAETNVIISGTELARRGHSVGILHGPRTGRGEASWDDTFGQRFEIPLGDRQNPRRVKEILDCFRPDVAYVHKMPDLEVLETLIQSGVPLVRMVHDHDTYCMRSYKYNYFTRKICTRPASLYCVFPCLGFIRRSSNGSALPVEFASYSGKRREIRLNRQFHRTLVVTEYMREELLRNGFDRDRIRILAPAPRPGDAGLRSSFSDRNLIVFAGQIIRGKGVDVLLKSLLHIRNTPFECVILGDGRHRAQCEKLNHKLGLNDRVHFPGFVPQETLKEYYRESTVMAISSIWPEPYATIGVEVMRYAIPVVAFDSGGIKDWLIDGYNGFLVPWKDQVQFAARLEQLLNDKPLAKLMGQRGQQLVNDMYNFDRYVVELERVLEDAAETHGANLHAARSG
jgi:glycosyltransferase involved in cell wall biosynthesis